MTTTISIGTRDFYIKECPFCGGDATVVQHFNYRQNIWFVVCKCELCGAQARTASCGKGKPAPSENSWDVRAVDVAIARWNQRYKEDEPCRTES